MNLLINEISLKELELEKFEKKKREIECESIIEEIKDKIQYFSKKNNSWNKCLNQIEAYFNFKKRILTKNKKIEETNNTIREALKQKYLLPKTEEETKISGKNQSIIVSMEYEVLNKPILEEIIEKCRNLIEKYEYFKIKEEYDFKLKNCLIDESKRILEKCQSLSIKSELNFNKKDSYIQNISIIQDEYKKTHIKCEKLKKELKKYESIIIK